MKFKTGLIIGGALGYYYGAKAGRERYEQIDAKLERLRSTTTYQKARDQLVGRASEAGMMAKGRAGSFVDSAYSSILGSEPEASYEPGLEFNPDFTPTEEEIIADLRGDAPAG